MKIGIIGNGAFAIAIASLFEECNHEVMMWCKMDLEYQELVNSHTNLKRIDYKLDEKVKFTKKLDDLLDNDLLIVAVPAKFIKSTLCELEGKIDNKKILIATKGLESENKELIHEYIVSKLTKNVACISGPSFAVDVIKKKTIGLTLAANDKELLEYINNIFNISYINLDLTNDIIGVELCGIIKNIMAIFSGILEGMNKTLSTKAMFISIASLEMMKIIESLGGKKETFYTYAGIGDLMLTATSTTSRNFTFGTLIGKKDDFESYLKTTTVEGLENLNDAIILLKKYNISSSIINLLYKIIYENESLESIDRMLLNYE